jgi:hypothetical protein
MSGRRQWARALQAIGLAAGIGAAPSVAGAAVLVVTLCSDTTPGGADGELRKAITDAADGDTILLPACEIVLTGASGEDGNATGDLDVFGKTLAIRGSGAGRTILDGADNDRVLHVEASTLSLRGVTLRGGNAPSGGGLQVQGASFVEVGDSEVQDSRGNVTGGGLFAGGTARVIVRRTTLAGNRAADGAGLVVSGTADVTVVESTVTDNEASTAGGLRQIGGALRVEQSTVSGNRATVGAGGGIDVVAGDLTLLWSTVTANTAAVAGGGLRVSGSATVGSSIVGGNAPADCGGGGTLVSRGHNLQGDGTCDLGASTDQTSAALGLGPLAANGGLTLTHALLPGSPALDAGSEVACPALDQRGARRPQAGPEGAPARCDAGAVERRAATGARGASPAKPIDPR